MATILQNTSSLLIAHTIGRLLAFALLILLPRYYPETQIGSYLWAVAITNIVGITVVFGMHVPLIRDLSVERQRAPRHVGNALLLRLLFSVAGLLLLYLVARLLGRSGDALTVVLLLGIAELLNGIAQLFRCTFRAFEEMHYEAIIVLLERLCVVLIGGGLVILGHSILLFCSVIVAASGLNVLLSLGVMLRRFTRLSLRPDLSLCRQLLIDSFPFALGGIFNIIYFRIDSVLLPKLCRSVDGEAALAWYGLAYSLVTAFTIIPGAFTNALFPVLSRLFHQKSAAFQQLYTHAFRLMFVLALPIGVGSMLLARQIVALLWDETVYLPGTIDGALPWLGWAGAFMFLNSVIGILLRAADRRAPFVMLIGGAMLFNIGLNLWLVPRLNHVGAALAMLLTEGSMFCVGIVYVSTRLVRPLGWAFVPRTLLTAFGMGTLLWLLRDSLPVWLLAPLAGGIYLACMVLWGDLRLHSPASG